MNIAHIVVLTIALCAGGAAACLASGSDSKPPPTEPVAQRKTVDVLVAKSDVGLGQTLTQNGISGPTNRARQRSGIHVVRYGVSNPTIVLK